MSRTLKLALAETMAISLALCLVAAAQGKQQQKIQPPAVQGQVGFNNGTISRVPWFNEPGVQKHLDLTAEQVLRLNKSYGDLWNRYNTDFGALGKLNDAQRVERMNQISGAFHNQFMESAQGVLSPAQFQRYKQLQFQNYGLGTINDPYVQQTLDLTADQRAKLNDFAAQQHAKAAQIMQNYAANPKIAIQEYASLRQQNYQFLNDLLTTHQRETWTGLTGNPYPFSLDWYFKQ